MNKAWLKMKSAFTQAGKNPFFLVGSALGLLMGWSLGSWRSAESAQRALGREKARFATTVAKTQTSSGSVANPTEAVETTTASGATGDWRQLLQKALSDPDGEKARDRIMRLIELTPNDQLGDLAESLKTINPIYLRESGLSVLMGRWSIHQPDQAAAFCLNLPNNDGKASLCETLVMNWGEANQSAALAWAQKLTRGMVRERAMQKLSQVLATTDPQAAIKLIEAEISPDNRSEAQNRLMQLWATHDFAGAEAWIKKEGESDLSYEYRRHAVLGLSRTDPIKAATYVSNMEASDQQTNLAVEVAQEWSNRDPGAAAQWALQFPEGTARDQSLQIIAAQYAQLEPAKAMSWMSGLTTDHDRNQAATSAIRMLVDRDLPFALKLMPFVSEAETKEELNRVIRDSWERIDPQNSPFRQN
jgi:hypothetical protein